MFFPCRARQAGQATVEYTIVLIAAIIILVARPGVIASLVDAIKDVYQGFVYAISLSWL